MKLKCGSQPPQSAPSVPRLQFMQTFVWSYPTLYQGYSVWPIRLDRNDSILLPKLGFQKERTVTSLWGVWTLYCLDQSFWGEQSAMCQQPHRDPHATELMIPANSQRTEARAHE